MRIWSIETEEEDGEEVIKIHEKPFSPLDAHTYSVNYVEFSPCGSMLASCSLDGTTLVWNTEVRLLHGNGIVFFSYLYFLLTETIFS